MHLLESNLPWSHSSAFSVRVCSTLSVVLVVVENRILLLRITWYVVYPLLSLLTSILPPWILCQWIPPSQTWNIHHHESVTNMIVVSRTLLSILPLQFSPSSVEPLSINWVSRLVWLLVVSDIAFMQSLSSPPFTQTSVASTSSLVRSSVFVLVSFGPRKEPSWSHTHMRATRENTLVLSGLFSTLVLFLVLWYVVDIYFFRT